MLLKTLLSTGALAPMQRESVRLLRVLIDRLDVTPQPDGTIRFAFDGDVALLDRLGAWGAHEAECEETGEDDEDDATGEACARRLRKLMQDDVPEVDVAAEVSDEGLAAIGDGLARLMPPQPTPAPLRALAGQIAA